MKNVKAKFSVKTKQQIIERDGGCCIICESNDLDNPHHVYYGSQANRGEDRNNVSQGVCICKKCHHEIHFGVKGIGQDLRGMCIKYLQDIYGVRNEMIEDPTQDYYEFYFEVDSLVPHQNNIKHTRFGAYANLRLKTYQDELKYKIKSQFLKQKGKIIDRDFVCIDYLISYKVINSKSLEDYDDLITTQRGDDGNIFKSIDDCFNGIVFGDDKQITKRIVELIPARQNSILVKISKRNFFSNF